MAVYRDHSTNDQDVVGRINSEHLSDQFQRELGHTADNDLLHDGEVKLDDISNASGSGIAALSGMQQPANSTRPHADMLATTHDSDDSWLVASPYTSPRSAAPAGTNDVTPADQQADRPVSKMERAPSQAYSQAYAQPSKIPRLTQASSLHRQPSSGASGRAGVASAGATTRAWSSVANDSKIAMPSKARVVKPAVISPPRSVSDTAEDGQPVWRNISKAPAPKYTQQTDAALGGPFERAGSSTLPRAGSTQLPRANSAKPRSRTKPAARQGSRPSSAKLDAPNRTAAANEQPHEIQLIQEPRLQPQELQSRILAAPAQSAAAEPDFSRVAEVNDATEEVMAHPEAMQAAGLEQLPVQQAVSSQAEARPASLQGPDPGIAGKPPEELRQAHNGHALDHLPVSADHVAVSLPEGAGADVQPEPYLQNEKVKKKCCCCVIM